jgi:hypothetical protein
MAATTAAMIMAMAVPAQATILLDFTGLNSDAQEGPANYYAGGLGSLGSGPGPNYGVTFSSNAVTCHPYPAGGCNTEGLPSGNALFYYSGTAATMDVLGGFTTGFSFYYTSPIAPAFINVWSGLDATGTLLATLVLPQTALQGSGCTQPFCPYEPIGVSFAGVAHSVDFGGSTDEVAFGDVTIGSATPAVPEPMTLSIFGLGLAGVAARRLRKQRV